MATTIIGHFTKDAGNFIGSIATLTFRADSVRIVAVARQASVNAPSHRVYAGDVEIGAAWPRKDAAGNSILNLKIDDPGLPGPVYPLLVRGDGEQSYVLVWSRSNSTRAVD